MVGSYEPPYSEEKHEVLLLIIKKEECGMHETDKLDRVMEKLGELGASMARMEERFEGHAVRTNEQLDRYNDSLDVHIRRTELLEKDMQVALLPIKVAKFLTAFASGATAVLGLLKLIGKIQ